MSKRTEGQVFIFERFRQSAKNEDPTVFFEDSCSFATCLFNSSLLYWFHSAFSDCEHINDALIRTFKIPRSWDAEDWGRIKRKLSNNLEHYAQRKIIMTKEGHKIEYDQIDASKSKRLIDQIDQVLAEHYGFTDEELDFIINYDIKYRMGRQAVGGEEEG